MTQKFDLTNSKKKDKLLAGNIILKTKMGSDKNYPQYYTKNIMFGQHEHLRNEN